MRMAQVTIKSGSGDFSYKNAKKINAMLTELYAVNSILGGQYVVSLPALAIGSTPANVSNVAFEYTVAGVQYSKAAVAAGVAPGDDVVPVDTYGAVALDIDAAGTVTVAEAADNVTGYATAVLAVAGIPAVAATKARMGTVSVIRATAGAFTFGTTSLADGDTTVVYTDGLTSLQAAAALVA
jgi:hypothetical protein